MRVQSENESGRGNAPEGDSTLRSGGRVSQPEVETAIRRGKDMTECPVTHDPGLAHHDLSGAGGGGWSQS